MPYGHARLWGSSLVFFLSIKSGYFREIVPIGICLTRLLMHSCSRECVPHFRVLLPGGTNSLSSGWRVWYLKGPIVRNSLRRGNVQRYFFRFSWDCSSLPRKSCVDLTLKHSCLIPSRQLSSWTFYRMICWISYWIFLVSGTGGRKQKGKFSRQKQTMDLIIWDSGLWRPRPGWYGCRTSRIVNQDRTASCATIDWDSFLFWALQNT